MSKKILAGGRRDGFDGTKHCCEAEAYQNTSEFYLLVFRFGFAVIFSLSALSQQNR